LRFNIKNIETVSFKKRYTIGFKKKKLIFGDFSINLCKSYNLEYIYLYNFKKSLKKYYNFKKKNIKKVWLFLHKNYPLTKKSKNSRMGKGKGSFVRFCSRILQNHSLLEFSGFNILEIFFLKKNFQKKINIPLKVGFTFLKKINTIYYKKNEVFFLKKKYIK
jgi:ribosomal protein L16/L10AE